MKSLGQNHRASKRWSQNQHPLSKLRAISFTFHIYLFKKVHVLGVTWEVSAFSSSQPSICPGEPSGACVSLVSFHAILAGGEMSTEFGSVWSSVAPQTYCALSCFCICVHVTPSVANVLGTSWGNISSSPKLCSKVGSFFHYAFITPLCLYHTVCESSLDSEFLKSKDLPSYLYSPSI